MSKYSTFAFIGGDRRQIYVILGFAKDGYSVNVIGIDSDELLGKKNITVCNDLAQAVNNADFIVLPVPYSSILDNENINTPLSETKIKISDLFEPPILLDKKLILAGKVDERLTALSHLNGAGVVDYMKREELAVLNAILTAEGAVKIAMEELPVTLHGSNCLCTGFGRVEKILCHTLSGLGTNVTVAVRKQSDLAYIKAYGYNGADITKPLTDPRKYDVVFNTVPKMIINGSMLRQLREDCLIIDLASKPGGVDFESAKRLGRNVIWALSLPGKTAPLTAGNIIRDTINNILNEQAR